MKYFIKTFGCQQNHADSERIAASYKAKGFTKARSYQNADHVIINTCMIRQAAENRVYGLVNNLGILKQSHPNLRIIVTGCMVGAAFRDKTGKFFARLRKILPQVDEFMPIEEIGFNTEPIRVSKTQAWVPISNGCNNFCTYCIVPFTRGREISRPMAEILNECTELKNKGYTEITLLGQNVNSYGADLVLGGKNIQVMRDIKEKYFEDKVTDIKEYEFNGRKLKPVFVKHLGRQRLPTLFPYLLEEIAKLGFKKVDFISSNPWDFSDELIATIAKHSNLTRTLHLPVQSGDNAVLKRMNRWYTREEYLTLIKKIRQAIPKIQFTTDIIVGFCGETDQEYENTIKLCEEVNFAKAYIAMYSERPFTAATKVMNDNIPFPIKKKRWMRLDTLVNKYEH